MRVEFRIVIPARYESSRFPGKALADLGGWPMLRHVWERARRSGAREVIIATDDRRIARAGEAFGAAVAITSADHRSGTERTAEVARSRSWPDGDIVVNCQGDLPLIPPASLTQVARLLADHPSASMATLARPIEDLNDYRNPHVVKVVSDAAGRALYFSRASIPALGHGVEPPGGFPVSHRHIGLYAYRVAGLVRLAGAPACYLEECERLEQLRALWLGMEIRVGMAAAGHGPDVDTPADLDQARAHLQRERGGE